jgi:hypothetical protein
MAKAPSFINETDGAFIFGAEVSSPLSFYLYCLNGSSENQYMLADAVEGAEVFVFMIRRPPRSTLSCSLVVKIEAGFG